MAIASPQPPGLTNQPSIAVSGTASDSSGIERVEVNATPVVLDGERFESNVAVVAGANTVVVRAVDRAGNEASAQVTVTRVALAEVVIATPVDLSWIASTTVQVTGSVSAGVAGVSVNGIPAVLKAPSRGIAALVSWEEL